MYIMHVSNLSLGFVQNKQTNKPNSDKRTKQNKTTTKTNKQNRKKNVIVLLQIHFDRKSFTKALYIFQSIYAYITVDQL